MKKILAMFLLFFAAAPLLSSQLYKSMLDGAEENYQIGNYEKTAEIYESLIKVEKIHNPYLYYNLSNAYYRNGKIGKAVANIQRAFLLKPSDKEIKHNKHFLESVSGTKQNEGLLKVFNNILEICSLNTATVTASLLLAVFLLFISLYMLKKNKKFKTAYVVSAVLFLPFAMMLIFKINDEILTVKAVTIENIEARSGPGLNNPEIFNLQEGSVVAVLDKNSGWSYIKSSRENFEGWVENRRLENING
jgi:Bacterial SH3 domain.